MTTTHFDVQTRVSRLRQLMETYRIDAYLVPSSDAHQSEYTVDADKRRQYISGFTGSAGVALIEMQQARLWTDGRYFLQAERELDPQVFKLMKSSTPNCPKVSEYVNDSDHIKRMGYDPYLHNGAWLKYFEENVKAELVPIHKGSKSLQNGIPAMTGVDQGQYNLVDAVWTEDGNRPAYPSVKIETMPLRIAGQSVGDKLSKLRTTMENQTSSFMILSALDDIAYCFNLRGLDVPYSRVFMAYALISEKEALLFVRNSKTSNRFDNSVAKELAEAGVVIKDYEEFPPILAKYVQQNPADKKVWIDSAVNVAVASIVKHATTGTAPSTVEEDAPIKLMKAVKNKVELEGMIEGHLQDSAALSIYLAWLASLSRSEMKDLDEVTAADRLEAFRKMQPDFIALSFPSISAMGPNGAVVHYRAEEGACSAMDPDGMYLIDSGAHYTGCTTDVTRTEHFGIPSAWEKELYTRVLRGHIALATSIFRYKTTGATLDILARAPLWEIGLNYLHGTGHGVGHSLEVHEHPPVIGNVEANVALEAGMVVSDEPGFYLDGKFGIRIENLLFVKEAITPFNFNGEKYLTFEHLTKVPYCRKLIEQSLLNKREIDSINAYHADVYQSIHERIEQMNIHPSTKSMALDWLKQACAPL